MTEVFDKLCPEIGNMEKIPQGHHTVALERDFLLKSLESTTVESLLLIWFPKTFCNHVCTCDDSGAELGVLTT